MPSSAEPLAAPAAAPGRTYWPALALAVATTAIVSHLGGLYAWLIALSDGLAAFAVVASACGWGAWPAVGLGLGRRPVLQQVCVSAALGLGILSVLTLVLGVAGGLSREVAWGLVGLGYVAGLVRLRTGARTQQVATAPAPPATWRTSLPITAVVLPLAIPLGIALFAATQPPGVLWLGENRAYDALEYHLQAPREYYDAGRVQFLPHNVYASFPQQTEMLYLLLMHMMGGTYTGAIPAQFLHVLCAVLAVLALAAWSAPGWPRRLTVLLGGTVPWLAYLGCLAYVEMAMLYFTAVAAGLALDVLRDEAESGAAATPAIRLIVATGLCAGLAGGCKYTALVLVAVALAVAVAVCIRRPLAARLKFIVIYGLAAGAAFSPWLVRNAAFTSNPVYPFAYRWFGGQAWSAQQDEQWARGHRPPPEQATVAARAQTIAGQFLASPLFGPAIVALAAVGLLRARTRMAALLALWVVLMLLAWALLTHMPPRFAVPTVVPLALLGGWAVPGQAAAPAKGRRAWTAVVLALAVIGTAANGVVLYHLLRAEDKWWGRRGLPLRTLAGATEALAEANPVTCVVPAAGRAWLVGEARAFYIRPPVHYTVVFNRDPWLEYCRTATPAEAVDWLRTQNVSHVVFSWPEIDRLRATYGFPELVTPEWVAGLAEAGLRPLQAAVERPSRDMEFYEVMPK